MRKADGGKAVVIGAGLGGLAAALCLANAGLDVTVIDRLGAPGGKLRAVPSPAGPVDAGPTVLTLRPVFDALFAHVGSRLDDHVTLVPEPVLARHWWHDGSTLDLHADAGASEAAIRDFAGPRAAAEFRAFNHRAARLYAAFDVPMMQAPDPDPRVISRAVLRHPSLIADMAPHRTLAASLDAQFHDPRLRQLFGRYATYVGGSPYDSPALLALIWRAEAGGVWRVPGGMHRLAGALQDLATARGARFLFDTEARRIDVAAGAVSGVHLADGSHLPAARVVFNGDPRALATGLLGLAASRSVPASATEPRSLSARVWSFASTPRGAAPPSPQRLLLPLAARRVRRPRPRAASPQTRASTSAPRTAGPASTRPASSGSRSSSTARPPHPAPRQTTRSSADAGHGPSPPSSGWA